MAISAETQIKIPGTESVSPSGLAVFGFTSVLPKLKKNVHGAVTSNVCMIAVIESGP